MKLNAALHGEHNQRYKQFSSHHCPVANLIFECTAGLDWQYFPIWTQYLDPVFSTHTYLYISIYLYIYVYIYISSHLLNYKEAEYNPVVIVPGEGQNGQLGQRKSSSSPTSVQEKVWLDIRKLISFVPFPLSRRKVSLGYIRLENMVQGRVKISGSVS